MAIKEQIESGQGVLGIELGSTRIKAVLIDPQNNPVASGSFGWENSLVDGFWTYSLQEVEEGLRGAYKELKEDVQKKFGVTLNKVKAFGVSAMMHGYLVFDESEELLVPFRTWRNNTTGEASRELTELFSYPIPQRWSIAHLYQAILNEEPHIEKIRFMTTLAGYVHWKLTGNAVVGVGEASGMFPIDSATGNYREDLLDSFEKKLKSKDLPWSLEAILPRVLGAGEEGGTLTEEGALWLDPEGTLAPGVPFCPPEGDAGTGMVATNSIAVGTGNVSAGTSVFAMIVLDKDLSEVHHEIDLVTTPDGHPVGMAHANNCTSDLNDWIGVLAQGARLMGADFSTDQLYEKMMNQALLGDSDCGGLVSVGYLSGEHITGFEEGRPLFIRTSDSRFTLENFLKSHLYSSLCAMKAGVDILVEKEGIQVEEIRGHGGFFKTPGVGQRIMAGALNTPVSQLETAGEGGAWGIALLAAYMVNKKEGDSLADFLKGVFADSMGEPFIPLQEDVAGFEAYYSRFRSALAVEEAAVKSL